MVTQKAISLKIDYGLLDELNKEANTGWTSRNGHINKAIRLYLNYLDTRRRVRLFDSLDAKNKELQDFLNDLFPGVKITHF